MTLVFLPVRCIHRADHRDDTWAVTNRELGNRPGASLPLSSSATALRVWPMPGPHADLLRVLRSALITAPSWWHPNEIALCQTAAGLDSRIGDALARLLQRIRPLWPQSALGLEPAVVTSLLASGWITVTDPRPEATLAVAELSLAELDLPGPRTSAAASVAQEPERLLRVGTWIGLSPTARALMPAALAVAFGGDGDLGLLARIQAGQLAAPAGSPLAGAEVTLGCLPWADRDTLNDWLIARAARSSELPFHTLAAAVAACSGNALHLVHHHLTAAHHWTRALWEAARTPTQRRIARRLLRRAPVSPALMRAVWEDLHAAWRPRPAADRLAAEFAQWSLWSSSERNAWSDRANGTRRTRTRVWPVRTLDAWLERDGQRVLADGELVEDLALRRLREDGWEGIHAEGCFWLAAAHLLLDRDPCPSVPWHAPLQATVSDWGRPGYGMRRHSAITHRAAELVRDPEACLALALARREQPLPGFLWAPPAAALAAVVHLLPARVLIPLLRQILDAPQEAAGLPDLVVWRERDLALWEVKSPGDQLSGAQRRWLGWLTSLGVTAGELRVAGRKPSQGTLFALPAVTTPARPRRSSVPKRGAVDGCSLLINGRSHLPTAGEPTPWDELLRWSNRPWRDVRQERPLVEDRLIRIPAAAVLLEQREGRRMRLRRWFPLPPGMVLVGTERDEALPSGGMSRSVRLLTRAAGWLLPGELAQGEPVVARPDEIDDRTRDWIPHPSASPPRPERLAEAWGCAAELHDQLTLLGSEPHGLWPGPDHLVIATTSTCQVLWTATSPHLVRGLLPLD